MSQHQRENGDLEALYREAGDIEPDSGLDRIVRARADEATRDARASGRLPWLGGLVTASVAIVAIAVVVQQPPPDDRPPSEESAVVDEPEEFMAPSASSRPEHKATSDADPVDSGAEGARSAERAAPATPRAALRDAAPAKPEREERAREIDAIVAERANIATEIEDNPEATLGAIRALIEDGQIDQARQLLDGLRQRHPDHVIPEDIEQAIAD